MSIVLYVDHDARQRAVTTALLQQLGCSVVAVPDASDALDTFTAHHPDIALVLCDARVSDLHVPNLVQRLNEIDARVPIVMLLDADAEKPGAGTAGVLTVLRKPLRAETLSAVLPASMRRDATGPRFVRGLRRDV